MKLRHIHVKL